MSPPDARHSALPEALHRRFTFGELRPPLPEVGVVLGYPRDEVPEVVQAAIDQVSVHGEGLWSIEGGCVFVPEMRVDRSAHVLRARDVEFQVGKIVGGQLSRSTALAVFLCTAGKGIEELSRGLMAGGDPFTGFVADTLGSLVVEAAMDRLQDALAEELGGRGLRITNRYSPGYCEWHVSDQQKLFRLLPAGYCGVSLTDTSLMRPIKSVSGFIGMGPEVRRVPYTCSLCGLQDCLYRRRRGERATGEAHG
jgi:hypothetical protein